MFNVILFKIYVVTQENLLQQTLVTFKKKINGVAVQSAQNRLFTNFMKRMVIIQKNTRERGKWEEGKKHSIKKIFRIKNMLLKFVIRFNKLLL